MATGTDRATLSPVLLAALPASPFIFHQGLDHVVERMVDRDTKAIAIHRLHHMMEIGTMIRSPLQPLKLPLMDHFVSQRHDDFPFRLVEEQRQRESNQPSLRSGVGRVVSPRAWTDASDKHPGRCGQSSAPGNADRRERSVEVTGVES